MDATAEEYTLPLIENGEFKNPWKGYTPLQWKNVFKFLFGKEKDNSNIPSQEVFIYRLSDLLIHVQLHG